jgi:hypothetical protein
MSPDGFDPMLERDLREAGAQSRRSLAPEAGPDPIFAAALRERLLDQLTAAPARRFGFATVRAFLPAMAASALLAAAVWGAGELQVGRDPASPTPKPTADPSAPVVIVVPLPTGSPSEATAEPTTTPVPSVQPTVKPSTKANPTPEPTAKPPTIGSMSLLAKPCDGGVVLLWSAYDGANFNHYATLRATSESLSGATTVDGSTTADLAATSGSDATGVAGTTYFFRTAAFNADGGVLAKSSVVSAVAKPTVALGGFSVTPDAGGSRLSWNPYTGPAACFTHYKLAYSTTNPAPSYLEGDPYLAALSTQTDATFVSADLVSGQTYYLRVQAIRSTALGRFVAAQTDVLTYTIP